MWSAGAGRSYLGSSCAVEPPAESGAAAGTCGPLTAPRLKCLCVASLLSSAVTVCGTKTRQAITPRTTTTHAITAMIAPGDNSLFMALDWLPRFQRRAGRAAVRIRTKSAEEIPGRARTRLRRQPDCAYSNTESLNSQQSFRGIAERRGPIRTYSYIYSMFGRRSAAVGRARARGGNAKSGPRQREGGRTQGPRRGRSPLPCNRSFGGSGAT